MKRDGFILSLDMMIAMVLAAILIGAIIHFVNTPKISSERVLYMAASDFLAVADESKLIQSAIKGDSSELDDFFQELPDRICFSLEVFDQQQESQYAKDSGCPEQEDYVIAKRTVLDGTDYYVARMRAWFR